MGLSLNHLFRKIRSEFSRSQDTGLAGTVDVEHQLPSVNIDYKQATIWCRELPSQRKRKRFCGGPLVDDINGKVRLIGCKEALKKAGHSYSEDWSLNQNTAMMMVMPWQGAAISSESCSRGCNRRWIGSRCPKWFGWPRCVCARRVWNHYDRWLSDCTIHLGPNLTTIAQPLYDLGAISMRMLTKISYKGKNWKNVTLSWFDRTPLNTKT